jgi:hypothetical protein
MTVEEVAAELYAVPPAQFTARRDERARAVRAAGTRDVAAAITALRRPTLSAWLVNALVRRRPDEVATLLDLGQRMRAATVAGDPALRALGEQRRAAVGALVAAATQIAGADGVDLSPAVEHEVTATLEAATASPDAARAVASGRLVRPITYAGFGDVPLPDVVALPDRLPTPLPDRTAAARAPQRSGPPPDARATLADAQRAARAAADAADDAQRAYDQRRTEAQRAAAAVDDAARDVAAARERLSAAEDTRARARAAARAAQGVAREAERAAHRAHAAADAARQRLAQLTNPA